MAAASDRSLGRFGRLAVVGVLGGGAVLSLVDPLTSVFFLSYGAVGAFLAIRRPSSAIGWLMLVTAFGFMGTTARPDADVPALRAGTASTWDFMFAWLGGWSGGASYLAFLALAIVFPAGHLPSGRWRRPATALIFAGVVLVVLTAVAPTISYGVGGAASVVIPNRFALLPSVPAWSLFSTDATWGILLGALLVAGLGGGLLRYRRTTGVVRLQLRWLVSAVSFVIAALGFGIGTIGVFGENVGVVAWIPAMVAYPTVPLAIGIAITRYRLFEIDRIISRTLGYALVTGVLAVVFAGVVLGLQALLASFTEGDSLAVAVSTLVVAALFQPIRTRVQRAADRRFNRPRYDAERTVEGFAAHLRDEIDLDRLRGDLSEVAFDALHPVRVNVWIRAAGAGR